jgi:hypoxanthine phosphoribosyltransferase
MNLLEEIETVSRHGECLFDLASINRELDRVAQEITAAIGDANPVVLCLMSGGIIPTGLLLPKLSFPLELDYIHATRYGKEISGSDLQWIHHPGIKLKDRLVLLVDDILDQGLTLAAVKDHCEAAGARACYSAVIVDKLIQQKKPMRADFVAVETEDRYLYGLGMDYKGYLRNQPGIFACADSEAED